MPLKHVSLDDKYTVSKGRVLITGEQALVRLPMLQKQIDRDSGLNTAGFISGYRGSPIGGYDTALWRVKDRLAEHDIEFQPGVNEDLAATAVWGTQQLDALPDPRYDGVFSIWYGKGPGVDRSGDALKHGNLTGSHRNGGVLVVYGDDHPGKSSSTSHQSEQALAANSIPSFYPADIEEVIRFGLLGWAMSRYTGLWTGLKMVNETILQTSTVEIDVEGYQVKLPTDGKFPEEGVHYRPSQYTPQLDEILVTRYKLPLLYKFVRANAIDGTVIESPNRRLGIVSAGKSYRDVLEALRLLGINREAASVLGISLYKVGCIWPLEPEGIVEFAQGQDELFFVEEKKAFMEDQAAKILYNVVGRPRITGKYNNEGHQLLEGDVQLDPVDIALAIASRIKFCGIKRFDLEDKLDAISELKLEGREKRASDLTRSAYFCSGCPHNTSTVVPEGSISGAGIGCHGLAVNIRPNTMTFTQMGGEGATWYGLSKFTDTGHIFQNLGDGTYYHSGLLAIRGAVAAGTNITYKILYNDAVAMTGGQPVDGPISVADITRQVLAEGVMKCVVVTDNPAAYSSRSGLAAGVEVYHRQDLEQVQRELRDTDGCTVLIYEQTCAAEKRRRRKRGEIDDPPKRVFINDAVCEGCGDCSAKANCVSIQPKETDLGRKREIEQSSCNKDFSCINGFCPSFVSIEGGRLKAPKQAAPDDPIFNDIPAVDPAQITDGSYDVMVSGIGGTGVITVAAILGMAAHLEDKVCSIYDMTGVAQKNGAVYSHLRIATDAGDLGSVQLGGAGAHLSIGFDMVAALSGDGLAAISCEKTHFIGNLGLVPTAEFQTSPDLELQVHPARRQVIELIGQKRAHFVDATNIAQALMGDKIAVNMFMVGNAAQKGLLPVSAEAIEQAIALNGIAVSFNLHAFKLGRLFAWQPERQAALVSGNPTDAEHAPEDLESLIARRVQLLTEYQDRAYARRYEALVEVVREAEARFSEDTVLEELGFAVAHNFAKLMAYKDEYEVARLHASHEFSKQLNDQFEGDFKLKFYLAPPLFSSRDPVTGHLRKKEFGGWMLSAFKLLAKFKVLRGTPLDIFGFTNERKQERQLIEDYEQMIYSILKAGISSRNYDQAVALAKLPEGIRGYGHVKERHLFTVEKQKGELWEQFNSPVRVEYIDACAVE